MRKVCLGWVFAVLLVRASVLTAGVYNSADHGGPFLPPGQMRATVAEYRAIAIDLKPEAYRRQLSKLSPGQIVPLYLEYRTQKNYLEEKKRAGLLTTEDRANLAACYLRLRRTNDAIALLKAGDRNHFLIQANLASAYLQAGEFRAALSHQRELLASWPSTWHSWTPEQRLFYRRVERYQLALLRIRTREELLARGKPVEVKGPYLLFEGLRFESADGTYKPGAIDPEVRDQLPTDAVQIVFQLVLWYPFDDRLYWLLAELLNAHGYVHHAYDMMDELINARTTTKWQELRRHRLILKPYREITQRWEQTELPYWMLGTLAPHQSAPVGVGMVAPILMNIANPLALHDKVSNPFAGSVFPQDDSGTQTKKETGLPLSFWHLALAFVFGAVFTLLAGLQWQEWRRRRQTPAEQEDPPSKPTEDTGAPSPAAHPGNPGIMRAKEKP